jgi:hypothetical protein
LLGKWNIRAFLRDSTRPSSETKKGAAMIITKEELIQCKRCIVVLKSVADVIDSYKPGDGPFGMSTAREDLAKLMEIVRRLEKVAT